MAYAVIAPITQEAVCHASTEWLTGSLLLLEIVAVNINNAHIYRTKAGTNSKHCAPTLDFAAQEHKMLHLLTHPVTSISGLSLKSG